MGGKPPNCFKFGWKWSFCDFRTKRCVPCWTKCLVSIQAKSSFWFWPLVRLSKCSVHIYFHAKKPVELKIAIVFQILNHLVLPCFYLLVRVFCGVGLQSFGDINMNLWVALVLLDLDSFFLIKRLCVRNVVLYRSGDQCLILPLSLTCQMTASSIYSLSM